MNLKIFPSSPITLKMDYLRIFLLLFFLTNTLSCSTSPDTIVMGGMDSYDDNSKAHGAAYLTDAINIRRPMPTRPHWKPLEFYYKHCSISDEKAHHTNNVYGCSGPY